MENPSQATIAVPDQHKIDLESLNNYIRSSIPSIPSHITQVKKFGYGQSNPTYHLTAASGAQYVMRKRPGGKLIPSAHRVDREFLVMSVVGNAGFPVPKVLHLCEDTSVLGANFYLMTFEKGRIPSNSLASLAPHERKPAMESIISTLAKLHTLNPTELGLIGPNAKKPYGQGNYYPRQLETMAKISAKQLEVGRGKVPEVPHLREMLQEFHRRLPADRVAIVHGDYKPDNVILHPSRPEVMAVVDWELSTIGHPLCDLANVCLVYYTHGHKHLYPSVEGVENVPSQSDVHRLYCSLTNTPYPIPDWEFYVAFALFRLAVISQGVAMRFYLGQASDTQAESSGFGSGVTTLGEIAWRILNSKNAKL